MDSREASPQTEVPQDSATVASISYALMDSPSALVDPSQMYPDEAYLSEIDSDDESYYTNAGQDSPAIGSPTESECYFFKKPRAPPKKTTKPFLISFTLFPKLPKELRDMIWRHTLEPRTVEIQYSVNHGFYSRAKTPIALRACPDSRQAVVKSYPLCFGSILHNPSTVFNFSLDTLYFEADIQDRVTQFLVSLSKIEAESLQSIAVDWMIDEYLEQEYWSEDRAVDTFKAASHAMPALKEFLVVHNIDDFWHEHGVPTGIGPMVLFNEFPFELQLFMWSEGMHMDYDAEFLECQELPNSDQFTKGFGVPTRSVFGWRPATLPVVTTPTWMHSEQVLAWNADESFFTFQCL